MTNHEHLTKFADAKRVASDDAEYLHSLSHAFFVTGNDLMAEKLRRLANDIAENLKVMSDSFYGLHTNSCNQVTETFNQVAGTALTILVERSKQ